MNNVKGKLSELSGERYQMLEESEAVDKLAGDVDAIMKFVPWYESAAGDTSCEEKKSVIP